MNLLRRTQRISEALSSADRFTLDCLCVGMLGKHGQNTIPESAVPLKQLKAFQIPSRTRKLHIAVKNIERADLKTGVKCPPIPLMPL